MASQNVKRMNIKEFLEEGYLQEANRRFFHPLGLALEVIIDDDTGEYKLGGVWDYRDDPEGMLFGDLTKDANKFKALKVADQKEKKAIVRNERYGFIIQPLGDRRV